MESNSEAGRIHCSEAAYKALNATSPDILCEKRTGLGPIKGKGKMQTYWVLGRAPMASSPSAPIDDLLIANISQDDEGCARLEE